FCFGCNLTGDAIKFVKLMEAKHNGLNDLQAYRKYLQILKSDKCSNIKLDRSLVKQKPLQREFYNEAYDYYHGLRKVNWNDSDEPEVVSARDYMRKRGFSSKTLSKCRAKVTYNNNYGLIFPMLDNGKFKGWVCRTMVKSVEEKRKYLYNEGFSRATTLVGNYGTKDYVFIVEGYMDRLKFVQFGEDNVVAILGWKMSPQQIQKLKDKGITKIISALDNDDCGKKGTKFLQKHFEVTRFAYLKGVKDPGEMTQESFDKMFARTMKQFKNN
ncbi:MAG: toprim domain-containing protein, partial [Bacteroidales bacterium]|nr:toprim domain-containing protein [Bacteroidales bacterium]